MLYLLHFLILIFYNLLINLFQYFNKWRWKCNIVGCLDVGKKQRIRIYIPRATLASTMGSYLHKDINADAYVR